MLDTAQIAQPAQIEEPVQRPSIIDEINRLRGRLVEELEEVRERLKMADAGVAAAEEGVAIAQREREAARLDVAEKEKQFTDFNTTFPAPPVAVQKAKKTGPSTAVSKPAGGSKVASGKPAAVGKPAATVVAGQPKKIGGRVSIKAPSRATSGDMTVPERVAKAMKRSVWSAGDLVEELERVGEKFNSDNMRSYISTILNSSMMAVECPDGSDLCDSAGKRVKVHAFTAVERGQYRVATADDVLKEVQKLLGASEVVYGDRHDEEFAAQGIEHRPAAMMAQH